MEKYYNYNIGIFYSLKSNINFVNIGFYYNNLLVDNISCDCEEFEWSEPLIYFRCFDNKKPIFNHISGFWICDNNQYNIEFDFNFDKSVIDTDENASFILGLSKNGTYAIWFEQPNKKILCHKNNNNDTRLICQERDLYQFTYRYLLLFEKWNDENKWLKYIKSEIMPQKDYIEEFLFDGTFDKLHDEELLKYHVAGKPKKISINWHINKTEYTAYFWFENDKICSIFERFYGAHPDTKTDFIIRIDAENKKYELALFRQGLKEPQIISEDAYQLLVFKNKFEDYRSDNYNQDRGAWIW